MNMYEYVIRFTLVVSGKRDSSHVTKSDNCDIIGSDNESDNCHTLHHRGDTITRINLHNSQYMLHAMVAVTLCSPYAVYN